MEINNLIEEFINKEHHERVVGRYNSSELYNILRGKLSPEDLFKPNKIEGKGVGNVSTGIASEDFLTKVFESTKAECEPQVKKEIKLGDIVIVAKPDFVFKDFVLEVKCPVRYLDNIPPWYETQCEAYHRAFKRQVYLGVISHPFSVKTIKYVPNDELWEQIKKVVKEFHLEVLAYLEAKKDEAKLSEIE